VVLHNKNIKIYHLYFFRGGGIIYSMTPEQVKQLTDIYDEAIAKLQELQLEKRHIIKEYIKQLEEQKIQALKDSLSANNQ
jgi:hypothetical protein